MKPQTPEFRLRYRKLAWHDKVVGIAILVVPIIVWVLA